MYCIKSASAYEMCHTVLQQISSCLYSACVFAPVASFYAPGGWLKRLEGTCFLQKHKKHKTVQRTDRE